MMNKRPIVSVIIPIYNSSRYLDRCINAILRQTYSNWELILVDDGSTDASADICNYYAETDTRITAIHQKNAGPSVARNTGMDIANGEYIAFVDSDDIPHEDYLEIMVNALELEVSTDLVLAGVDSYSYYSNYHEIFCPTEDAVVSKSQFFNCLFDTHQKEICTSGYGKLFRRTIVTNIRWNPMYYLYEDIDFLVRVVSQCELIQFVSKVGYSYEKHQNSLSTMNYHPRQFISIDIYTDITKLCKAEYPSLYEKSLYFRLNFLNSMWIRMRNSKEDLIIMDKYRLKKQIFQALFRPWSLGILLKSWRGICFSLSILCKLDGLILKWSNI